MNEKVTRAARLAIILAGIFVISLAIRSVVLKFVTPAPVETAFPEPKINPIEVADKAVGNRLDRSYVFTDQDGNEFDLGQWYDKPLIISYIFTNCPQICPAITTSLSRIVRDNKERLGVDFRVVSVGFDYENDTPEVMREYGASFTDSFENWKFVTGPPETVRALARRLGIIYRPDGNGSWEHTVGVTIVAPGGYVLTPVFGATFSTNQIMGSIDRALAEAEQAGGKR